jgi:hypothetical protein
MAYFLPTSYTHRRFPLLYHAVLLGDTGWRSLYFLQSHWSSIVVRGREHEPGRSTCFFPSQFIGQRKSRDHTHLHGDREVQSSKKFLEGGLVEILQITRPNVLHIPFYFSSVFFTN